MFNVRLIKKYTYEIAVKGYSKINSLGVTIKYETNNLVLNCISLLKSSVKITEQKVNIVISKIKLVTNPRLEVVDKKESILTTISSKEKIANSINHDDEELVLKLKSREKISDTLIDKVKLILNPQVGYYRKLVEFDSLTLAEVDNLTLEEMDVIISAMSASLENEGVI